MLTLFAIPNCDTVKKARVWLDGKGISYQFHDYKKEGIDRKTIENWLKQKPWDELINKASTTWKALEVKPENAEEAIAAMIDNPSVIRRPLIESDGKIIAQGFKADKYEEIFK
ncbi:Spx/MgsR family RNA polymerase-binding regulatory protein [Siphonobacter aquaeclarae]|jgi:arsenate reductase|uniref:Arsenate reductase n=1 Tax=Siphonobacter aquaeclarae TaxID=563176 RepID=A0A1G9U156_9BACT|nr:Spx/MgsR family RNA polymerase-binding regulatory protein [Siphonobacter aquaeclarae]MBO9637101.1 Spx/MgsR family RNA polymerase-binding regulatory protein [Siphonobacter aquaeclarae]SDM53553.1 arsenate reductase [Siphonobacter aquaeclarae]